MELRAKELKKTRNSLGETDEVLVVGVHVGQLDVYQQQHLNLRRLKGGGESTLDAANRLLILDFINLMMFKSLLKPVLCRSAKK